MSNTKKCSKCRVELPITKFYKNKLILDGHSNYCIDCTKVNSKKYFERKKERTQKNDSESLMKMMLLSNLNVELDQTTTDNLMKLLIMEKLCKSLLGEIDGLKKSIVMKEKELIE